MSRNRMKQVILNERVKSNHHMVSGEYRRHLRIQTLKVWIFLLALAAIFTTTAIIIIN